MNYIYMYVLKEIYIYISIYIYIFPSKLFATHFRKNEVVMFKSTCCYLNAYVRQYDKIQYLINIPCLYGS